MSKIIQTLTSISSRGHLLEDDISIKRADPSQHKAFARIVVQSGEEMFNVLFGPNVQTILAGMFQQKNNLYSYTNVLVLKVNGKTKGVAVFYDHDTLQKTKVSTGMAMLKFMGLDLVKRINRFIALGNEMGQVGPRECYLSNIAITPKARGHGYGARLLEAVENRARRRGCNKLVLDVDVDDPRAQSFYRTQGYHQEGRTDVEIQKKKYAYYKMVKKL